MTANGLALCALHHKAYDIALITLNRQYDIIHNEKKFAHLRQIGLDGEIERFISELKPFIHLPPAINDRPHIDYITISNLIRGWE